MPLARRIGVFGNFLLTFKMKVSLFFVFSSLSGVRVSYSVASRFDGRVLLFPPCLRKSARDFPGTITQGKPEKPKTQYQPKGLTLIRTFIKTSFLYLCLTGFFKKSKQKIAFLQSAIFFYVLLIFFAFCFSRVAVRALFKRLSMILSSQGRFSKSSAAKTSIATKRWCFGFLISPLMTG